MQEQAAFAPATFAPPRFNVTGNAIGPGAYMSALNAATYSNAASILSNAGGAK